MSRRRGYTTGQLTRMLKRRLRIEDIWRAEAAVRQLREFMMARHFHRGWSIRKVHDESQAAQGYEDYAIEGAVRNQSRLVR